MGHCKLLININKCPLTRTQCFLSAKRGWSGLSMSTLSRHAQCSAGECAPGVVRHGLVTRSLVGEMAL